MKNLAIALCLLAGPALADEQPVKPTLWLLVIQIKASSLNVTYPTEEACRAGMKVSGAQVKKLGLGRADCIPVVQP